MNLFLHRKSLSILGPSKLYYRYLLQNILFEMPYMLAVGDFHLKKVNKCIIHKVSPTDFSKEEKAVCKMLFEMNSDLQICEGLKTRNAFYLYMHTTGFF